MILFYYKMSSLSFYQPNTAASMVWTSPQYSDLGSGSLTTNPNRLIAVDGSGNIDLVGNITMSQMPVATGSNNYVVCTDTSGNVVLKSSIETGNLPASAMEYKGTFNALTGVPALNLNAGSAGDVYIVSVDGMYNHGAYGGSVSYLVGDWVVSNGTIYQRIQMKTSILRGIADQVTDGGWTPIITYCNNTSLTTVTGAETSNGGATGCKYYLAADGICHVTLALSESSGSLNDTSAICIQLPYYAHTNFIGSWVQCSMMMTGGLTPLFSYGYMRIAHNTLTLGSALVLYYVNTNGTYTNYLRASYIFGQNLVLMATFSYPTTLAEL
jgi:hypothetical protein